MNIGFNLEKIKSAKVLIVGDLMLDQYVFGSVSRISPEAPVPVVKAAKQTETLGGSANVAHNIASLGANCDIVGVAGADKARETIVSMFDKLKIRHHIIDAGHPTTSKIRLIGERQQIARIDYEELLPADSPVFENALKIAEKLIDKCDVVVLSDYGKGMISESFTQSLIKRSKAANKITIVDPKGADWAKYAGATIITPNVKELSEAAGLKIANEDETIETIGESVRKQFGLDALVVTRSEKGISVITSGSAIHIPTRAQEVFDVSGAGDTVVGVLACALGAGADINEAVEIANKAAGIVVSKIGTVPVLYEDLFNAYHMPDQPGAIELARLSQIVDNAKKHGKRIAFTNGCFDVLHRGHIDYIHKAKHLGDILIIGLNSDDSVCRLKGSGRPVNNEKDRAFLLSSLRDVDYVVVFHEDTPRELLEKLCPDVLIKGGDYTPEQVIGREYAGETVIIDFVDGYSSTNTIEKMRKL